MRKSVKLLALAGTLLAGILLDGMPAISARQVLPSDEANLKAGLNFYGVWQITEVQTAPWVPAKDTFVSPYDGELIGKTISFERGRIVAPSILACKHPQYEIRSVGADYLFQSGLTDPARQAAALGFPARIVTLLTGCEGWFEFHFVDTRTAMFALDNRIFTIRAK